MDFGSLLAIYDFREQLSKKEKEKRILSFNSLSYSLIYKLGMCCLFLIIYVDITW